MSRPLKLAVIGGGPSAFYVASRLLSLVPQSSATPLNIHLYDKLWAPHGLVRYGVAPDHPEVKNCVHKFDGAALDPRLKFFGNVSISSKPSSLPYNINHPLSALYPYYSHILFSSGCPIPTANPVLPFENGKCVPALSLVHWYTLHPSSLQNRLPSMKSTSHVTLIGQGNVSLDIARILLGGAGRLEKYDVPESVLQVLRESDIRHITIVGRRGPAEVKFTAKEVREMMTLEDVAFIPIEDTVLSEARNHDLSRQQKRIMELLKAGSKAKPGTTKKSWSLEFYRLPHGFASNSSGQTLSLDVTALNPSRTQAVSTGVTTSLKTDLVVTSLGHTIDPSNPAPSQFYNMDLGRMRTSTAHRGRVVIPSSPNSDATSGEALTASAEERLVKNMYASGWAATGARGVLAATLIDAHAVAESILSDHFSASTKSQSESTSLLNPSPHLSDPPPFISSALAEGRITSYEDWKVIDAEEVRRGQVKDGKERERMDWEEVLRSGLIRRT
ncbi:nucleotide-binding domain-containing protein [Sistotremastrum suecicum HHB10207 ss-3]|uniref:Nucleotide-binding domain-containing protein n=1 Tax=Sistotremastrum suecicum HHB10207 ss-3 TaxID=1314776 RepID=A0A165ZJJ0_9AGAM|nr:nucleotide-binding domain-containing protein [Sistotremastrum suecicum HHB10207 ss-3]